MSPFFKWAAGAKPGLEPRRGRYVRPKMGTVQFDRLNDDPVDDDESESFQARQATKKKGKKQAGGSRGEGGDEVVERLLLKWTTDEQFDALPPR